METPPSSPKSRRSTHSFSPSTFPASNPRREPRWKFGMARSAIPRTCTTALITLLLLFASSTNAVLIKTFRNCLPRPVTDSATHLQFHPLAVDASLDHGSGHQLNLTIYGNVTGSSASNPAASKRWLITFEEDLEERPGGGGRGGRMKWSEKDMLSASTQPSILGKRQQPDYAVTGQIVDRDESWDKVTTLRSTFNVLTFNLVDSYSSFCGQTNGCPVKPVLNVTEAQYLDVPDLLPSFHVTTRLGTSYAFASVVGTFRIISGNSQQTHIGCIKVEVTPPLGDDANATRYSPLGILILVGVATISAAILNPWNGTKDIFRWSTNYGMDDDMLRLVTPGFGDCLQYIQFVVMTGSLTLAYPGFFQPIVSSAAWSILMFNNTLVSDGGSISRIVDGVYAPNATYGLEKTAQLVGIHNAKDIWPTAMAYLAGVVAGAVILIQFGFVARWIFMKVKSVQEEDLRAKNLPFTLGNMIRIFYNYLLNPFVALTTFQFIVAKKSPALSVGLAGTLISIFITFTVFILYRIATYKPRSALTDDLSPLLLYGSLYNTYRLDATSFAMIQVPINILRALSFGVLQPSGIAQLTLLAICEVVLILTYNAVRPYSPRTSMNLYQTFFSGTRLVAILFSVAFIPELSIDEGAKGWVGYVVLLMHGIVLCFGFFLNALQTIVEIVARLLGAGNDNGTAARGGLAQVFGKRQLSRRRDQLKPTDHRQRADSSPSILGGSDGRKSTYTGTGRGRPHSRSNSSAVLLGRNGELASGTPSDGAGMLGILDTSSGGGRGHRHTGSVSTSGYTPTSPIAPTYVSGSLPTNSGGAIVGLGALGGGSDPGPYYRPPRARTNASSTIGLGDSPLKSRNSSGSGDWGIKPDTAGNVTTHGEQSSVSGIRDSSLPGSANARPDYTVREMDFYYGVRGPALSSNAPSRRLGTGPADPTGPISVAKGWVLSKFGRSKDKGKGFEVVRSARAPEIRREMEEAAERARRQEEQNTATAVTGEEEHHPPSGASSGNERDEPPQQLQTGEGESDSDSSDDEDYHQGPSGTSEESTRRISSPNSTSLQDDEIPTVPRKSSKRKSASLLVKPSLTLAPTSTSLTLQPTVAVKSPTPTRQYELYDPPLPALRTHSRNSSSAYEPMSPVHQQSPHSQHYLHLPPQHDPHMSQGTPGAPSSRLPFSSPSPRNSLFPDDHSPANSRNSSTSSSILPPPPGIGRQNTDGAGSRPASVGTVNRHRMEDSLRSGLSEEILTRESAAELGVVRGSISDSTSRGNSNASRASNRES